jgi:hypothetical protein
LLTVSIPDLKPNSQDTSAFYLKNIYQVLGNLSVSHPSIPSALAKPPAFSPPRYAVWVNSLWFLSLALSLWGAGNATMRLNWTLQYIGVTQWPRFTPVSRARMLAVFRKGSPASLTISGSADETVLIYLSLFLFIAGGLIYLYNLTHATFYAVVWLIGVFAISFIYESVGAFLKPHYVHHNPLSSLGLWLYLGISYVAFQVCSHIRPLHGFRKNTKRHFRDLSSRYNRGFLQGKLMAVRDFASEPSSEIDDEILLRVLDALDDDHAIETFFDAIPGFCNSKFTVFPLSPLFQMRLRETLDGFLDRTFSSTSISESTRTSRLITCLNATYAASGPSAVSQIFDQLFNRNWDEALQSVEIGHALRHWVHYKNHDLHIQRIIACIIARAHWQRRDGRWMTLVQDTFGVPDSPLRDDLAHGDSVLLSILIRIAHQADRFDSRTLGILSSLSKFDIRNTLPELQHDFCALWNEIVQEARHQGSSSTPAHILREIRHLYIALHQGINHAPTVLSASTESPFDPNTLHLSSCLCDIASHRPDSTARVPITDSRAPLHTQPPDSPDAFSRQPTLDGSAAPRLAKKANNMARPPSPPAWPNSSITSEIGETSQAPIGTFPVVHSSSPFSERSLQDGVSMAQPDATPVATLSHPLENNKQDSVAPWTEPLEDSSGTLSNTPTSTPLPTSDPRRILNKSPATNDTNPTSISKSLFPAPSIDFSTPDIPLPSHVPPLTNAESPLLSGTSSKGVSDDTPLPDLGARTLVSGGNRFLSVLQLLVHCPPFWDLFRSLGRAVNQREAGETGGVPTPLVDATVRLLDEFANEDKSPVTQQFLQQAARGKVRENDKKKDGADLLTPTSVYDAMMVKRPFINVSARSLFM